MRGALLIVVGLTLLYLASRGALDCLSTAAKCVRDRM